ncbi:hypothetical protein DPMN_134095 [Dreissena polymorpha]|uniref:Uncharacterized protein n=1 Tax=Dreissena polymorpha TaxID=45954 RepID=A0A9D4G1E6_DREPO|nr:hypothetical protein DPMN_134095 [Dreissena polymorpha]
MTALMMYSLMTMKDNELTNMMPTRYNENSLYDHLGIPTNSLSRPPFFSPDLFLLYFNGRYTH